MNNKIFSMIACLLISVAAAACGSSSIDEFVTSSNYNDIIIIDSFVGYFLRQKAEKQSVEVAAGKQLIRSGPAIYDFGIVSVGGSKTVVFTIKNKTNDELNLTNEPAVLITADSEGAFSVSMQPGERTLAKGGSQTFSITFTPGTDYHAMATVQIANDSPDVPFYEFGIIATGSMKSLAQMAVYQGETRIADGASFDFGTVASDTEKQIAFTIINSGTDNLVITESSVLLGDGPDPSLNTSGTAIRFRNENSGTRSYAFFSCYYCDCTGDSSSLCQNISYGETGPYMATNGSFTGLYDGSTCASSTNTSNMGFFAGNMYTITETPEGFQVTHDGAGQFSMPAEPPSLIAAGNGRGEFTMSFKPTVAGRHAATVKIVNNSTDTPEYAFTVTGTVAAPQMSVFQGGYNIKSGSASLNYERTELDTTKKVTYRIINNGAADIVLTDASTPVQIAGGGGQFTVSSQPLSPIPANGGYRDFTVSFKPAAYGVQSASITIPNDTSDTPSFKFNVSGIGVHTIPAWINNGLDEPIISSATSLYLTIEWPEITGAHKYELFSFSSPDCSDEIKITDTGGSLVAIPATYDTIRVKALGYSSNILDTWVVSGKITPLPSTYGSGEFADDFKDGVINPAYVITGASQVSESGGYMQLDLDEAGAGPGLYIGYDPEGKRYVHLSLKWLQHRESDTFYGSMTAYSYLNNFDSVTWGNYYDDTLSKTGTYINHSEYDPHGYQPDITDTQLDAPDYFDEWFDWNVCIDTATGTYRVTINDTESDAYESGYYYGYILIFKIALAGDGTGHYILMDDLLIESSDTEY